jgi:hypothetical protein
MKFKWTVFVLILHGTVVLIGQTTRAGDPQEDAIQHLLAVGPDAAGADKAQKAVDALVAAGPKVLPAILAAVPDDVVKANWLRVAFIRIVYEAIREKKPIPADELLSFVNDKTKPGRSRRLALEAVEKVAPGTTAKVIDAGLDDPEFGADAVAARMDKAAAVEKADPAAAAKLYREAFDAARDGLSLVRFEADNLAVVVERARVLQRVQQGLEGIIKVSSPVIRREQLHDQGDWPVQCLDLLRCQECHDHLAVGPPPAADKRHMAEAPVIVVSTRWEGEFEVHTASSVARPKGVRNKTC